MGTPRRLIAPAFRFPDLEFWPPEEVCDVFQERVLAYTLSLLSQVARTFSCNRVHLLDRRMAG